MNAPVHLVRGAASRVGRYTQRAYLRFACLEGAVLGVFILNEYVAKKTLRASDPVLTALVMSPTAAFLFSAWWSSLLAGREKSSTFLVFGLLGRFSLVLVALAAGPLSFAGVIAAATLLSGAIIPAQNALLQRNFTVAERGRVVGLGLALQAGVTIVTSLAVGRLYDLAPGAYRAVYPAAAVCGFLSCLGLARVRYRARPGDPRERPLFRRALGREIAGALRRPFAGALGILREDPGFRRYEIAFMCYGMAWMMLQPVIPTHLVERLRVAYAEVANARGLVFYAAMALLSPLFGRLLDRAGPLRVSRLAFLVLGFFPIGLALAGSVPAVYAAFLVYGVGMSAVNLGWTMGPIHFAGERDSAGYMGAHVALVGVRSLIGGPFGIWFYRATGSPGATFAVVSALFFLGAALVPRGAMAEPARRR